MKVKVFKIGITLFMFLSYLSLSAQDFQGKAYYETKTTLDLENLGGGQMSEEQKKRVSENMKSMLEKTFILTFNKSESIYKEEERLEAPGTSGGGFRAMMSSFTGGPQYKNVKEGQLMQEQEFFGKQFLVKDDLKTLDWKMDSETKQIGNYTCFKATTVTSVDEMDFMRMRRRGRGNDEKKEGEEVKDSTASDNIMDELEVPKEITVTAWYAPQIPVNQGPSEYWGLPGLILEVNAGRTTILCSKIILNPEEKESIETPSKGKVVTRKEYNDIMKKKIEEMREMFQGRRGGNRRN